ncbi:MAG: hypothetical protein PHO15_00465 [Eubacteriales bacterium]|nr:hypothetical protein [Eubacteriales bacterium]
MKAKSWKETLIRAGRTFVQTFIGTLAANFALNAAVLQDANAFTNWAICLVAGAIAAGVAAVMNLPSNEA